MSEGRKIGLVILGVFVGIGGAVGTIIVLDAAGYPALATIVYYAVAGSLVLIGVIMSIVMIVKG